MREDITMGGKGSGNKKARGKTGNRGGRPKSGMPTLDEYLGGRISQDLKSWIETQAHLLHLGPFAWVRLVLESRRIIEGKETEMARHLKN
jgi:hypothetical protein